ncbi:hypothetical protein OSB04_011706 [Centaurea solstitialis]|uniref:Integrase catalytic domain-containing protein n=1 Tax=Centaurea solstitialis TaxID=347529 RepID=A0AA38WD76_9ASTR|nr:hypothetical protein OSB04_011706 [Centaurea solstitialis]
MLVLVDEFSRFTWLEFLRAKSDAADRIIAFIKRIQVLLGRRVKTLRSDNGTEFSNAKLQSFLEDVGISHNFSAVRTPQQNGVVERKNRTLVEAARSMMAHSGVPQSFWAEAVSTACYTQNRTLIVKRTDKTAYEMVEQRKPNIDYFRVFGCKCYVLNDRDDLGKFECDIRQILTLSIMSHESDPSEYRSHGSPEHPGSENGNSRSRTAVPERDPYSDDDADSRPVPAVRTGLRIRTTARKSVPLPTRMTFRIPTGDGAGPSRVRGQGGSSSSSSSSSSGSPPPYRPSSPIIRVPPPQPAARPPPVARPSPVPRPPHMARAPVLCLKGMTPTERQEVARLARGQDIHEHLLDHHDHMIDSLLGVAGADSQQLTRIVALLSHTMASLHHLYTVVYLVVTVVVLLLLWTVWRVRA